MDDLDAPVINKDLERAAKAFLVRALAELRREHAIPSIRRHSRWQRYDGPWPEFWPCWEVARGEMAHDFIAALRVAYPDRFGIESKFKYKDPEEYVRAFLQAVVAANVVIGHSVSASSPVTRSMLRELHGLVSVEGQRFTSLWLLDDVDFHQVHGEKVGGITLLRPSNPPEMTVSDLLPGALWASDRGYPVPGAKHGGLLHATEVGTDYHYPVTTSLNNAMGRFMQSLRLATAGTSIERMVWIGEPSMIHVESPLANPQSEDLTDSWWRRIATVTPDNLPGLRDLTAMIDRLEVSKPKGKKKQGALPSIVIAIRRHSRSYRVPLWQDTVLELSTSLEACLGPRSKDQEIGLTLRTRAAHLLAHDDSQQADDIYKDITDLYAMRSDLIHGNPHWTKDLQTLWAERGYVHLFEKDRMHTLLDRWRDIVRRAITARLMLADEKLGTPLWPFVGDEPQVDRLLARRDMRDEWHARIVAGATAYGLRLLANAAPPLIDTLERTQSSGAVVKPIQPVEAATDADTGA